MNNKQKSCAERVQSNYDDTMATLRALWESYCNGEEYHEEYGSFCEYGLSFDYVPMGTFADQERPYFRYQLSWGGPSDEFRFYVDYGSEVPYYIEYWFLDWFDGAYIELEGEDFQFMQKIFQWFADLGLEQFIEEATV